MIGSTRKGGVFALTRRRGKFLGSRGVHLPCRDHQANASSDVERGNQSRNTRLISRSSLPFTVRIHWCSGVLGMRFSWLCRQYLASVRRHASHSKHVYKAFSTSCAQSAQNATSSDLT